MRIKTYYSLDVLYLIEIVVFSIIKILRLTNNYKTIYQTLTYFC